MKIYYKTDITFENQYQYSIVKQHKTHKEQYLIPINIKAKDYTKMELVMQKKDIDKQKVLGYHWKIVIPFLQEFFSETQGEKFDSATTHILFKVWAGFGEMINKQSGVIINKKTIVFNSQEYKGRSMSKGGDITADEYFNAIEKINLFIIEQWGASIPECTNAEKEELYKYFKNI